MAFWSRLTSIVGGAAVGRAAAETLAPTMENILQDAWKANAIRQLNVNELGRAIAEQLLTEGDATDSAARQGYGADKLAYAAELNRVAPGVPECLAMLRRGIITEADLDEAFKKHGLQDRWFAPWAGLKRNLISAQIYANLWLKGWITQAEAEAGGALTGYEAGDVDLMYKSTSRPAANQQMATAVARGVVGPDGVPMDEAQFVKGIRESDIRTEWAGMLWGIRYAYPPLFQLNRLVQAGAVDAATAVQWAGFDRYAPDVLTAMSKYWGGAATGGGKNLTAAEAQAEYEGGFMSEGELRLILQQLGYAQAAIDLLVHLGDARRVSAQRGRAVTAIEKVYLAHEIGAGQATSALASVGVGAQAAGEILAIWDIELSLARRQLTPAEIVRAYKRTVLTQANALTELEARGYTAADAQILLEATAATLTDKEVQNAYGAGTITLAQAEAYLAASGHTADEISVLLAGIVPK
jgi:hypothetical protein